MARVGERQGWSALYFVQVIWMVMIFHRQIK